MTEYLVVYCVNPQCRVDTFIGVKCPACYGSGKAH